MDLLTALIIDLVVIAILFEVARRANLPYPALFVLGGLALGFIPGLPSIHLEPELVLLVFLPPLLFVAAFETPHATCAGTSGRSRACRSCWSF